MGVTLFMGIELFNCKSYETFTHYKILGISNNKILIVMIYTCARLVIVIGIILLYSLTKQHYIPPPDSCAFAKTCNHTGVSICGLEKNLNTRLFLDECDLFEYNCDYHKEFTETDKGKCSSNETVPSSTMTLSISPKITLNISVSVETTTASANTSEIVNTTITKSDTESESVTVNNQNNTTAIITNNYSLSTEPSTKATCVHPAVTCAALNITTSQITNSSITLSNTRTELISTTTVIVPNTEVINNLTSTEATTNLSNTKATSNVTVTKAIANIKSTGPNITTKYLTSTQAVTNFISSEAQVNTTYTNEALTTAVTIVSTNSTKTALNVTGNVSALTTCTISNTSSQLDATDAITTDAITPKHVDKTKSYNLGTTSSTKEDEKSTAGKDTKTSQDKCAYPKHCNRPSTWQTTAKGETRDFYQILRAQFGDRVKLLQDTTHFPRQFAKDVSDDDEGFQSGYHNERTNEVLK